MGANPTGAVEVDGVGPPCLKRPLAPASTNTAAFMPTRLVAAPRRGGPSSPCRARRRTPRGSGPVRPRSQPGCAQLRRQPLQRREEVARSRRAPGERGERLWRADADPDDHEAEEARRAAQAAVVGISDGYPPMPPPTPTQVRARRVFVARRPCAATVALAAADLDVARPRGPPVSAPVRTRRPPLSRPRRI